MTGRGYAPFKKGGRSRPLPPDNDKPPREDKVALPIDPDASSGQAPANKTYTGPERRRHPRLTLDDPARQEQGHDRRQGDRRQSDRHQAGQEQNGRWQGEERRKGDRRQNARRSVDALRAQDRWTTAPDNSGKGFWGLFGKNSSRGILARPSRFFLVLVALISGGIAAVLATQSTSEPVIPEPVQAVAQAVPEPRVQVLVASREIGTGQRLEPASLTWQDWPQDTIRPEFITATTAPQAIDEMKGAIARFGFFPGEPIRRQKLASAQEGYLSAVLQRGKRGVSVSVSAEAASGGFILPNDYVDVVATQVGDFAQTSSTILRAVRVLAIDARLGDAGETGTPDGPADPKALMFENQAIATLELDPTQAEIIIGAAARGQLSLILLSADDISSRNNSSSANDAIRLSSPFWQN